MMDHDPNRLLYAFQQGDEAAFELVFKQFYNPLRMQAFLLLKHEQEAEDLVQQLFLDIWNKQLYQKVQQSLPSYLHTAVRNRCLNQLTKAKQETAKRQQYANQASYQLYHEDAVPALQPCLMTALQEMPTQRYKAFHLVHLQEKKYGDAALEMGISVNSLKSHLKLGVKFLRLRLQK